MSAAPGSKSPSSTSVSPHTASNPDRVSALVWARTSTPDASTAATTQ
jgi:hypothetical protein